MLVTSEEIIFLYYVKQNRNFHAGIVVFIL